MYNFDQNDYEIIKIKEKIMQVAEYQTPIYVTPFMDLKTQQYVNSLTQKLKLYIHYFTDGERKVALISNNEQQEVNKYDPLVYLKINCFDTLSHSSIMGAILNLGLKREVIGDIYAKDGLYLVCVDKKFSQYIIDNLTHVSHFKVHVELSTIKINKSIHEIKKVIVSSNRLDNFVSSIFNMSREKAKEAIINKEVFLNFVCDLRVDQKVVDNSYLSCRKKGKVLIKSQIGKTRKENMIYEVEYY